MRIVAGRWRGRRITAPVGDLVRPTGDRVREAWMSIVQPLLVDARVVDLCAGSGALGLEALSRGAASCDFVESSPRALRAIDANLAALGGHPGARLIRSDALAFLASVPAGAYDVAFADPPYDSGLAERIAERWEAVPFAGLLGIEHAAAVPLRADGETRRYGQAALTFFRMDAS